MLVYPSKMKLNYLLKDRTLNFETVNPAYGNKIFIATENSEERNQIIASKLFRPTQLLSFFVPRKIKPLGRTPVILNQAEYYKDIKQKTNGRIKFGKINFTQYNGKNLVLDISEEYNINYNSIKERKQGLILQKYMKEFFENQIRKFSDDVDYQKNFIIFPMINHISNFRSTVKGNIVDINNPLCLFLKSIYKDTIDLSAYKNIDLFIFFNPNSKFLIAFDLKDPDLKENFEYLFAKLVRLNNYNNKTDLLDDIEEDDVEEDEENVKENIKNIVLGKISKTLKANLTDYEASNHVEKELITSIDDKIEKILTDPINQDIVFDDLIKKVEVDSDVKLKAIRYVETKKVSEKRLNQLSKNLDKEIEVINSIADLSDDNEILEPEVFKIDIPFFDKRMQESRLASLDEEYTKKQAEKDLINVISNFSNSEYLPMTIESFEREDTSDDFNIKETIKVRYKTDDGKILNFQIDIPKIVDKKYFYLSGNKKDLSKQLLRLPLTKTKEDRVELTTSFNKITFERTPGKLSRKNASLLKILKAYEKNKNFEIVYGVNGIDNGEYINDFEYEELANSLTMIKNIKYLLLFNRKEIEKNIDLLDLPENFIKNSMTPFGFEKDKEGFKKLFFIEKGKISFFDLNNRKIEALEKNLFDFITEDVLGTHWDGKLPPIGKSFIYSRMKFLATTYPVFVVVGALNGISDILKRYNVEYFLSEKKMKKTLEYIEIKFRDKFFYYKDTIKNTLLLNPLYLMNPEEYDFNDFNLGEPYDDWFVTKLGPAVGLHTRNTLRLNLSMMMDPITIDVMKDLKMPTNIVDVILLANTMLIGNSYSPLNDWRNYRIRSTETIYAMLYGLLAEAFLNYQKHRINGRPLNLLIPRNKLISNIITLNTVNDHSTLNPIQELENTASVTAKGYKGVNIDDAFTLEMRSVDVTMNGIASGNATPYSGSAGISRSLTFNPKIDTIRGYISDVDQNSLSAANILSPTELLSTFTSAGADAPRQAMVVAQTKHGMPVESASKQLIGSGMNKTIGFMISDDFCFKAKEDGKIESINEKDKLAILLYNNGEKDAIDLNEVIVKNSNSGFFIKQQFLINYKEGEPFKKGDVLAYNPSYFTGKGKNIDFMPGTLAKVAITSGDFAFEDSTLISETLSKKCISRVTMMTDIALGPNSIIYEMVDIGDDVKTNDSLIEFTSSFIDPSTSEFLKGLSDNLESEDLESLTRDSIKTKHTGKVVGLKMFYNTELSNLSPSLQEYIRKYKRKVHERKNALKGIRATGVHIPPVERVSASKIGKKEFPKEGGVIIQIWVEYYDEMAHGDKLTYNTALKGIISKVLSKKESPTSSYRTDEHIEGILSATGVISRMTADVFFLLFSNKVLIELGKQIREIWENKR